MTQTINLTQEQYAHLVAQARGRGKKSLLRKLTIDPLVGTLKLAQGTFSLGYNIFSKTAKGVGILATYAADYQDAKQHAESHDRVVDTAKKMTDDWNKDHPENQVNITSQMIYNHIAEQEYSGLFNRNSRANSVLEDLAPAYGI